MTIRIGALGCSSIARRRALPALATVPGAALTAVASRWPATSARFAADFGVPARTYEQLLDDDGIDAVYLSLPTGLHHEWTRRALLAGKHVLCEKPLTTTVADTAELTALATRAGLVLRENFTSGHHPQHRAVRELLDAGRIGVPRSVHAVFCVPPLPAGDIRYDPALGGGSLLDVGFYPLRIAQTLLGPDLTVLASVLRIDAERGVDVGGSALLLSGTGASVLVEFGFEHGYRSRYAIAGSTGELCLDRAFTPPADLCPVVSVDGAELVLPAADQWQACIASFVAAVRDGRDACTEATHLAEVTVTAELLSSLRAAAVQLEVKEGSG